MRITAILVPTDEKTPLSTIELVTEDIATTEHITATLHEAGTDSDRLERLLERLQEIVDIERPEAALVTNESSLPRRMPFNKRATRLLWCHASQYRSVSHPMAGPVFVTGRRNEANQLTSVPDELMKLLAHEELQGRGTDPRRRGLARQRTALHVMGRRL